MVKKRSKNNLSTRLVLLLSGNDFTGEDQLLCSVSLQKKKETRAPTFPRARMSLSELSPHVDLCSRNSLKKQHYSWIRRLLKARFIQKTNFTGKIMLKGVKKQIQENALNGRLVNVLQFFNNCEKLGSKNFTGH